MIKDPPPNFQRVATLPCEILASLFLSQGSVATPKRLRCNETALLPIYRRVCQ